MKKKRLINPMAASAILSFAALCQSASATTFNAVNDFSLSSNPNGVWTYLYGTTQLPTAVVGSGGQAGWSYWWSSMTVPNSIAIGKNTTASPITLSNTIVVPVNYLSLDPEQLSADLRFTTPADGTYSISGSFLGIDMHGNSHPVQITDNGVVIFSNTIATYGQLDAFNLSESLHAGDVLDFKVLTGSTYTYLSTGLSLTISNAAVAPEPQTFALLLAGLGCLGWARRKRRA